MGFRDAISAGIPSLLELMKDPRTDIRSIAVAAVGELQWEDFGQSVRNVMIVYLMAI